MSTPAVAEVRGIKTFAPSAFSNAVEGSSVAIGVSRCMVAGARLCRLAVGESGFFAIGISAKLGSEKSEGIVQLLMENGSAEGLDGALLALVLGGGVNAAALALVSGETASGRVVGVVREVSGALVWMLMVVLSD